ncbi:hypothetical protein Hanom_Chr16g01426211 [Helianthus anomalus]
MSYTRWSDGGVAAGVTPSTAGAVVGDGSAGSGLSFGLTGSGSDHSSQRFGFGSTVVKQQLWFGQHRSTD